FAVSRRGSGNVGSALLERFAQDVAERGTRVRRTVLFDRLLLFGDLARLDREVRLLRTIEPDHHRIELLARLEAVRTLFVAIAAEIGTLDEPGGAIVAGLHFEAAIANFEHGDRDHVVLLQAADAGAAAAARGRGTLLELLHAEADALLLDIDVEHDRFDFLALAMQRERVFTRNAPGDVGHVDHAVHVAGQADEQAELGGVLDFAFDDRTHRVLVGEFFPRIAVSLLEAEADAALVGIDLQHHDFDFLAGRDDLAGMNVLLGP